MSRILWRSSLRYLVRHRVHSVLSVLGVALGVAVVFSIDVVNHSAKTAFRLATVAVVGRATHQITATNMAVDESVYARLRTDLGFRRCAPVVRGYVACPRLRGRALQLLGVDPFAEAPFRSLLDTERLLASPELTAFLLSPGAVYLSDGLAAELGVAVSDEFELRTGDRRGRVHVVGLIASSRLRGFDDIIVGDIATAQEVLGFEGQLSSIDLIIRSPDELARIERSLPPAVRVERSGLRTERVESMTAAFSRNLFALSLLALVVGMFLIYNTIHFSVVQRRGLIGDLRTVGVTRREIFVLVLTESVVIGAVGTGVGLALGFGLAKAMLVMVTRTINDLYFVLNVARIDVSWVSLVKCIVLGVGAAFISGLLPAAEATRTTPRSAQYRSTLESAMRRLTPRMTLSGVALIGAGAVLLALPVNNVFLSYTGLVPVVAGFAFLTPGVLAFSIPRIPLRNRMGVVWRMALRAIDSQLSRAAVAVAALAIAVGTTVGVTTMVDSFRRTVVNWLETTLDADVYVSPPSVASSGDDATVDSSLVLNLPRIAGVSGANFVRARMGETDAGMVRLVAVKMRAGSEQRFIFVEGEAAKAWTAFESGSAIIVSEPYAYRHQVGVGDSVRLLASDGFVVFPVAGVYRDYASELGTVMMRLDTYRALWRDEGISGVGLFVTNPDSVSVVMQRVRRLAAPVDEVLVRSNRDLREASIAIFNRTFAITDILRMLTVVVAFIGVLTALMSLQLERAREFGVLRALGMTPLQLWRLMTYQSGVMGFAAGVLALPFGLIMAVILVFVINKRSFGWTLDMYVSGEILVKAVVIAVVAALIAGLYPAFKMARTSPARALREE